MGAGGSHYGKLIDRMGLHGATKCIKHKHTHRTQKHELESAQLTSELELPRYECNTAVEY